MLKSEMIMIQSLKNAVVRTTAKEEVIFSIDYLTYVTMIIRHSELTRLTSKKSWKDALESLESAHVGIDVLTLPDSDVNTALGIDAGQFLKDKAEYLALNAEISGLPITWEDVTGLDMVSRVNLTLLARMCYKNISLLEVCPNILDPEHGGVDLAPIIRTYYVNGSCTDAKKVIMPMFNNLLGHDSVYFKGLKLRKSGIPNDAIRNFMASFGGVAGRVKSGKGEKATFSSFHYLDKSGDRKKQFSALTTLLAVLVDNATCEVITAEEVQNTVQA